MLLWDQMSEYDMSRLKERPEARCSRVAGSQFGLITRAQARSCGMSDSRIARRLAEGGWRSRSGVLLLPGFQTSWHQELMHALLRAGDGAVASHRSAGALLGLDGMRPGVVEIYARHLKSSGHLIVHRSSSLPECDLTRIGPIPTTNVSRTLVDLGAVVDEEAVEVALESALHRRQTSVARLRWRLAEVGGRGHRGAGTLRRLLDQRDPETRPAQSALEVKFARALRKSRIPNCVRQFPVRLEGGRKRYIDFAFPDARLGVEVGGREFHSGPAAEQRDSLRHNQLTALGWRLLYFTWHDVEQRIDYVIDSIRAELGPRRSTG